MPVAAAPRLPDLANVEGLSASLEAPLVAHVLGKAQQVAARCAVRAADADHEGATLEREFGWLHEAGLLQAPLPCRLGGEGWGVKMGTTYPLFLLLREIGRGSLPVGRVYEGHVNALHLISLYGTARQQARFADAACAGKVFAVWNTEAADGVRLVPTGRDRYRLEGAKTFASGAPWVDRPFVNGALPDGSWQMTIVPLDTLSEKERRQRTDASWWKARGMQASASYRFDFTGLEIGAEHLIGQPGDYLQEPHFNGGAVRFAAVQLGGAQALFEAATAHLRSLKRTGDVHQQARMGEAAIRLETGTLWLLGAARIAERDVDAEAHVAYAQMTRTAIEAVCLDVLRLVDRSVGARGLMPPSAVERIGRDLRLYLRQPAPDAVLTNAGRYALETPPDVRPLGSDHG
ncbi:MAG: acyl-CoA dehydrogenase family protein [Rhodothermales bacterium]